MTDLKIHCGEEDFWITYPDGRAVRTSSTLRVIWLLWRWIRETDGKGKAQIS